MLIPVILAGGSGTRLWPLSRELFPKQFLALIDEQSSLFQETLLRLATMPGIAAPIVVCNEEHRFLVAEQLRSLNISGASIVLEPVGKNTAPAVALAAFEALELSEDAIIMVFPADHYIRRPEKLIQALLTAQQEAEAGELVTFGVVPSSPETGYGYIKAGATTARANQSKEVAQFVEKPNLETAKLFLASGEYLWNSGMFMFKANRYLEELQKHAEDIYTNVKKCFDQRSTDLDFKRIDKRYFAETRSESIDYAVMEKTANAVVFPLDADWSDVGAWNSLWELKAKDEQGNAVSGEVIALDTTNSLILAKSRTIATIGLDNVVIVETDDAVLIAAKDKVQRVKDVVQALKKQGKDLTESHVRVYRPWGWYESTTEGDRFQVKRILVKPKHSLSLQMHHHRAEHWIVVQGTAIVWKGEEKILLGEDQSTYIPLGSVHRLENPGVIPLEIVEVQTGSYLGEDDIVRFSDHYGRTS